MMNLPLPSNQARKQHRNKTFHFAFVEYIHLKKVKLVDHFLRVLVKIGIYYVALQCENLLGVD